MCQPKETRLTHTDLSRVVTASLLHSHDEIHTQLHLPRKQLQPRVSAWYAVTSLPLSFTPFLFNLTSTGTLAHLVGASPSLSLAKASFMRGRESLESDQTAFPDFTRTGSGNQDRRSTSVMNTNTERGNKEQAKCRGGHAGQEQSRPAERKPQTHLSIVAPGRRALAGYDFRHFRDGELSRTCVWSTNGTTLVSRCLARTTALSLFCALAVTLSGKRTELVETVTEKGVMFRQATAS